MKSVTKTVLFGAIAVLACCVATTSGDGEVPPDVRPDHDTKTTTTKTTTKTPRSQPPAGTGSTRRGTAATSDRPANGTGWVATISVADSITHPTVAVPKTSPTRTATDPHPSSSTTTSSPYSIYDMRYYMDEESLARETTVASASQQLPNYEVHAGSWEPFTGQLTTPSVPYFDRMHSSIVAGIESNIDQSLTSSRQDTISIEREEDNTVEPSQFVSKKPSDVRLDYSNKIEIVYNGTKDKNSIRRDLVVINGTHIDLEINSTTVYPIEDFSTVRYYEQTTPQDFQQSTFSDSKEATTNLVTTTDIPGTTDALTNNLRSPLDNNLSANSVHNEITTVSPGEINSTTNAFSILETNRPDYTTEQPNTVPTTSATFSLNVTDSQTSTNVSTTHFSTQKVNENDVSTTEDVSNNIITTTLTYEPSSTTKRRPMWVPRLSDPTTTATPETTVPSLRKGREHVMSLNTSDTAISSDAMGSGSAVELLTTESPEENTVYPLLRSSMPSSFVGSNATPTTRRKTYTFQNTLTTKITAMPSLFLSNASSKNPEDNIITVDRSLTSNASSERTNTSAQNKERNDISSLYIPPGTHRGTIRYTSKATNDTGGTTAVPLTAAIRTVTALRGTSKQLRRPLNATAAPITEDDDEASYVRVPTVEKPNNTTSARTSVGVPTLSGIKGRNEINRTTTQMHFTPLGPTRLRNIAEDDRNSSEWPNSFSKVYIFSSTTFPPFYNSKGHTSLGEEEIRQNQTHVSQVTNTTSMSMFTDADHTTVDDISTEITTQSQPEVTLYPATDAQISNTSETMPSSSTSATFTRTVLFPTSTKNVQSTPTTEHVTSSTVTKSSTVKSFPVLTNSTIPVVVSTTERDEPDLTTMKVVEDVFSRANTTPVTLANATQANTGSQGTGKADVVPPGDMAAVHNGSVGEDVQLNGSKPVQEEDMHHGEDGLTDEEGPHQHGDGNQLPDVGQPSREWNNRGPNRGEAAHEDTLPPLDDADYGGGGNDLDTVGPNNTGVDPSRVTIKKDTTTPTYPAPAMNATSNSTTVPVTPPGNVPSHLLLLTDASWYEVCRLSDTFRTAVATLLSQASSKLVQSEQIILLNVSPALCSEVMLKPDASDKQLVPIEFYIADRNSMFDLQMCQEFRDVWKDHQFEYPYPVRSVELVSAMYTDPNMTEVASDDYSSGTIAAIVISCVGIVSLILLAVLVFVLMRKRQKRFNYGQRCTPVSLDAYSLDSVSVCNSVRRKAARASKRSYGNPAFDDPNAPTHAINFAGLANFSSDTTALEEEFGMIPQLSPKVDEVPQGAESKNRYANVIPLPETRVMLTLVEGDPLSGYINANYVRGPKGVEKFYIACQAPLQTTITDFWRMVWEHQSKVILMLTDLVEDGKEKCADYLPPSEVTDCHRLFGDFQITLKKREVKDKYIISVLQIKNLETNLWREVAHLWYLGWPAQGVPEEATSLIAFLIEARSYTRANTGPIVAHCSPGTGRTGTVLACDLCIREFEQTRMVDIPRCVSRLRRDRAGAVQTKEQYSFIYQVLNIYATKLTGGALDSL